MDEAVNLAEQTRASGTNLRGRRALALLVYLALSWFFFGRGLPGHPIRYHIGVNTDEPEMVWLLVWWPHAIAHGLNPFLTKARWAPYGFNLAWTTCIPLASLLVAPLTEAFGPVTSLNVICLLSLPIAAWCAFVLCESIGGDYWPALLGGFIFGFSPSLFGQLLFARLQIILIFPVPLAVYLAVGRLHGEISAERFVAMLALVLSAQFYFSTETFATMTMFGAVAIGLAWLDGSADNQSARVEPRLSIGFSYLIALAVISPYVYFMLFGGRPYDGPIWSGRMLSADLLNFLIPSPNNAIGLIPWFDSISASFNRGVSAEQGAYLSLPLVIVAALYARRHWREPLGKLLADSLIIILVLSLGGELVVGGVRTPIVLPWRMAAVSVLKNAAPVRFVAYAFLILAMMTSSWLSNLSIKPPLKLAIGAVIFAFLLPNPSAAFWVQPARTPAFFADGSYRDNLSRDEIVLILPFWPRNDSMRWQAETHMYFRMAQGAGPWPAEFRDWPIMDAFYQRSWMPDAPEQFKAYVIAHRVAAVIIADDDCRCGKTPRPGLALLRCGLAEWRSIG